MSEPVFASRQCMTHQMNWSAYWALEGNEYVNMHGCLRSAAYPKVIWVNIYEFMNSARLNKSKEEYNLKYKGYGMQLFLFVLKQLQLKIMRVFPDAQSVQLRLEPLAIGEEEDGQRRLYQYYLDIGFHPRMENEDEGYFAQLFGELDEVLLRVQEKCTRNKRVKDHSSDEEDGCRKQRTCSMCKAEII